MSRRASRNAVGFLMFMGGWSFITLNAMPREQVVPVLIMGLVAAIVLFTDCQ